MEESKAKSKKPKKKKVEVAEEQKDNIIICPENMKPLLIELTFIMRKQSKLSRSKRDWVQAFIRKQIQDGVIKLKE